MTVIATAVQALSPRGEWEPPRRTTAASEFRHALSTARRDVVMVRSHVPAAPEELADEAGALRSLLRRWVRISAIWDERMLAHPATSEYLRWQARAGVQVRTAARVPVTLALVDYSTSVVRGQAGAPGADRTVTVSRCPETVSMLHYLFLGLWEAASQPGTDSWSTDDDQAQDVLRMLARGLTDEQIAHRLDVSKRTVSRTVTKLMRELNARSRFEAGVLAARQGWFGTAGRQS
ncbi:LuxR C-terminal-related transcriptional regulator [Streptomyces sp. NPDC018031]|uniref:helix-turn-helix transcriptional regulator n=1 Tax=Streptomyces sp. NPDC018031 TaxID=3365033 RepID=UPI00378E8A98